MLDKKKEIKTLQDHRGRRVCGELLSRRTNVPSDVATVGGLAWERGRSSKFGEDIKGCLSRLRNFGKKK